MIKTGLFLLLGVFFLSAQGITDWESITNFNNVTDITFSDNGVWAVSDGGMFRYNPNDSSLVKFNNLQGLRSLDLKAITHNEAGQIIVGGSQGLIQIYDPQSDTWAYNYALQGKEIYDLLSRGDTLWVATREGAGVFIRRAGQYLFKDFFHNFPIRPGKILRCQLFNGKIWLATDQGLLSAPSDFGRFPINDPRRWQRFPQIRMQVNALSRGTQFLWIGTNDGLFSVDKKDSIRMHTNWKVLDSGAYLNIDDLLASENTLYVASGRFLYSYKADVGVVGTTLGFKAAIHSMAMDTKGNVWVGQQDNGIASTLHPAPYKIPGPPTNELRTVYKDRQNNLWLSGSRPKVPSHTGIIKYDGEYWTHYQFYGHTYWSPANDVDAIYQDRFDNMWFATWGGGVIAFTTAGDTLFFNAHSYPGKMSIQTDGLLRVRDIDPNQLLHGFFSGAVVDEKYAVITSVTEDPQGNLWFANYYASNDHLLAVAPFDASGFPVLDPTQWVYFGSRDGIRATEGGILCLAFDAFNNRVYIGTFKSGLYILDYGSSLADKSDDHIYHYQIKDNLFSNFVQSLAVDQDGTLWIGTASGLNSFDGINIYKHVGDELGLSGPLENNIRSIVVDQYNNKWFATSGGVSILRANRSPWDPHAWKGLNTLNSYLVGNNVYDIYVDEAHGDAYFATDEGLSIYRGSFAEIRKNFNKVAVGPNPYFVEHSGLKFVIKNLMQNSTVKIFTVNGRLVRELTTKTVLNDGTKAVDGGRAYWDGRDRFGNKVASGIYLYLAYTEEGKSTTGKFAVIRK